MRRIAIVKTTGKLIEMQSGEAPLGTLTQNAIQAGYAAHDVEEKLMTEAEWEAIKATQIDQPMRTYVERERKIVKEMHDIAEKALIARGEMAAL